MMEEYNFFININSIKNNCIEYIKRIIYNDRKELGQDLAFLITNAVKKAFDEIEKLYNNDVYINILKKKNLLLDNNFINNNNDINNNNNINNNINNNNINNDNINNNNINNNDVTYRRKNFIMKLNDQDQLKAIIEKAKRTYGYDNHITKRKAIADNKYIYWLLLEFKNKTTLSNKEVFNSIDNTTFNSVDGYESFINSKGEDFLI